MSTAPEGGKYPGLEIRKGATEDVGNVFTAAARSVSITDTVEHSYINSLLDRSKRGELGLYALMAGCRTVGAMCYRELDRDAELVFGHVLAGAGDVEGYFLESVVDDLFEKGIHTVRTNFNWPEPHRFTEEARALGFTMSERMGMCRSPVPVTPSCAGCEIGPWQDRHTADVCRAMCEDQAPVDRAVYPVFSRPEGARALMDSVLNDRHGKFLRELSYVACADGRPIGFLISTLLPEGSILILDISVDRDHRRRGVGGALLDRLVGDAYAGGYGQIVLAVTAGNDDAIRLYERKGFKVNGYFRQHVLSKIR